MGRNASDLIRVDKKKLQFLNDLLLIQFMHNGSIHRKVIMTLSSEKFEAIAPVAVPEGFNIQGYRPGDKEHWLEIHRLAEPGLRLTPAFFDEQFGTDERLLSRRQLFALSPDGIPAGTATAWFSRHFPGREWGRVHYVAVRPDFQRLGLGRALVVAACIRLRELGCSRAYLVTWLDRLNAIRLYERLGFVQQD